MSYAKKARDWFVIEFAEIDGENDGAPRGMDRWRSLMQALATRLEEKR